MDILKFTDFWISKNKLWISKKSIQHDFWISKNVLYDIHKLILRYPKMNYGYLKIDLLIA